MMPDAHFATVYAKPKGRPLVDTFITEVSQDTWIHFPWDTALSFQPPIRDGGCEYSTRHCEREAKQSETFFDTAGVLDRFVAALLAMTA